MNIQQDNQRKNLQSFLACVPMPVPHYFEDKKVQRRVGLAISAVKMPPVYQVRTIWL